MLFFTKSINVKNIVYAIILGISLLYGKHKPEYETHVSGLHNTYLTLVLRLGMPYLLIFLLLIFIFSGISTKIKMFIVRRVKFQYF